MTNDESDPKSECRRRQATDAWIGFRASGFFRISSFGFRHCPEPPHVGRCKVMNDLKFAFRQLLKNPGFTTVAVLTLALGIGANTAIFSVVNCVLLRPLPFPAADRLVMIHAIDQREGQSQRWERVFDPDFKQWTEQNHAFVH